MTTETLQALAALIEEEARTRATDLVSQQFAAVRNIVRPALCRMSQNGMQEHVAAFDRALNALQEVGIEAEADAQRRMMCMRLIECAAPVGSNPTWKA